MNKQITFLNDTCIRCGKYGQSDCAICSTEGLRQELVTASMKLLKNRKLSRNKAEVNLIDDIFVDSRRT